MHTAWQRAGFPKSIRYHQEPFQPCHRASFPKLPQWPRALLWGRASQKSSTMARSLSIGQTEIPQKLPKCPFQPQHGASLPKGEADNRDLVPCWGKGMRYGTNRPNYTKRDKSREPPDDLIGSSSGTFPAVLYVSNRGMHALLPRPGDRVNHPKDRGEPRGRRHCWGSPNPAWGEQQPSPCMHCVQSSSAPSLCGLEWVACVVLQSPAHLSKGC